MKVAIVYFADKKQDKMIEISETFKTALVAKGHRVEIFDGNEEVKQMLTSYDYIIIGVEQDKSGFVVRIPPRLSFFLSACGTISGKRSFAWLLKASRLSNAVLTRIMRDMEKQGLSLHFSAEVNDLKHAVEIGAKLSI